MLNYRNKKFVLKDSAIGAASMIIDIDLGSGVTRRADYLIIGNYKFSTNDTGVYEFLYSDNGS